MTRSIPALAVLLLAFFTTVPSFAQSSYDSMDADWWTQLEEQLTVSVASEIPQVRQEAMRHVVFFAENFSGKMDLEQAAFEVMGLFESSENVSERLLALAALGAIGEEITMQRLAVVSLSERSSRVRAQSAAVLQAHSASL